MKILFVIAHLGKGGGQQIQSLKLMNEISKTHQIKLLALKTSKEKEFIKPMFPVEYVGELKFPTGVLQLSNGIKKESKKFQIIQLLDPYYSLPAYALSHVKKKAFLRLGVNPIKDLKYRNYHLKSRIYMLLLRFLFPKVRLIVNNEVLKDEFQEFNPTYIPNGYDPEEFKISDNKHSLRKKLRLPLNKRILLYTGKVIERKNLDVVFEALRDLDDSYLFVVIGNKNEELYGENYYRKLVTDFKDVLHKVRFVDEIAPAKVIRYLKIADLFVFPSKLEGMSNSIMEALFSGLPILCSDIPENRAIKCLTNKNFFKNSDELGQKLKYDVITPINKKLLHEYDISIVARKYLREYQK